MTFPQVSYGPRPSDWHDNIVFTEFVFLRDAKSGSRPGTGLPPGPPPLPAPIASFLAKAKREGAPVIAMTFSSMPVPLEVCPPPFLSLSYGWVHSLREGVNIYKASQNKTVNTYLQ